MKSFSPISLRIYNLLREKSLALPFIAVFMVLGLVSPILGFLLFLAIGILFWYLKAPYFFAGLGVFALSLGFLLDSRIPEYLTSSNFKERGDSSRLEITGSLVSDSRLSSAGYNMATLKIQEALDDSWTLKQVLVVGRFPDAFWGDQVRIVKQDVRANLKGEEEQALIFLDKSEQWTLLKPFVLSPLRSLLKEKLEFAWDSFSPMVGDFSRALFWGDRTYLLTQERELFASLGLVHVLALSGFHLGLWAVGIFFILRLFLSRRRAELLLPFILLSYLLLVGFYPSLVRAWIFVVVWIFYRSRVWHLEPWSALSLTLILSLIFDPSLLSSLGFGLSFLAFGAILTDKTGNIFWISLRIFVATSPLIFLINPSVPLAGFVLTPVVSLLILWFMVGGFLGTVAYFIFPPLVFWIDIVLRQILEFMETLLTFALPFAFPVGRIMYLLIVLSVFAFLFFSRWRKIGALISPSKEIPDAPN